MRAVHRDDVSPRPFRGPRLSVTWKWVGSALLLTMTPAWAQDAATPPPPDSAAAEHQAEQAEAALEDNIFQMAPVVVTATRTEQDVTSAPASVTVVTQEDLKRAPVGDLTDAIRLAPGISLTAGSQGRRGISIRGMDSSYTLILVDGKRVNSLEAVFRHNDFDIGLIPTEGIERIEVVRGAMSSLYGSEALGGVINIITKPIAPKWTGGIDLKAQTPTVGANGEELRSSVFLSGPLIEDTLSMKITGGFNHRQAWNGARNPGSPVLNADGAPVTREDGSVVNHGDLATLEGRNDHNGQLSLNWTPTAQQTITAEYGRAYQNRIGEYYIGGSYGDADAVVHRNDAVLGHKGKWDWGNSEVRGYWEGLESGVDGLTQDNIVAEANATAYLGINTLTVGGEARWIDLKSDEFTSGGASVHQQALYAQDELALMDKLTLLLGARLDNHENFGLHFTPRAYAVYSPINHLTLKAGVGTGFKAPTLRQMSTESLVTSCRGRCGIIGNPDLDPEKSTNFEVSANWTMTSWALSATVFQNNIRNLIDTPRGTGVEPVGTDPGTGLPLYVPRNVNRARLRGVEATASKAFGNVVRLSANYTFLESRDLENDVQLAYRPKHTLNGQIDLTPMDKLKAFVRGQYIGPQLSGTEEVEAYALFDAGASYDISKNFGVNAGVLNIANTRTEDEEGYVFQERGRTLYAGVNARF